VAEKLKVNRISFTDEEDRSHELMKQDTAGGGLGVEYQVTQKKE
jgi:hypothetical protein